MNDSLRLHVEEITNLPSLPAVAHEILALADSDLVSVNKLESIIKNDPAISAKILSIANSAFYGFHSPARALDAAVMRIGFNSVKNIALGISIMTVLDGGKGQKLPDYKRIYNHSISVGFISKLISKRFRLNITEEIVISGMLHDIGLLILSRYFPDRYTDVLNSFKEDKALLDAEKEIFSFNHSDIGRWLADKWSLPDTVSDAISYHHYPACAERNKVHVAAVHVADYIADRHVIRSTSRDYTSPFDPACLDLLGMSENDLNGVVAEVRSGSFFNELFIA